MKKQLPQLFRSKAINPSPLLFSWLKVLLLMLCLLPLGAEAQITVTIGNTSGTNSYLYGPIYRSSASSTFDYSRYAYIYESSELTIPAGSVITKIEWLKANSNTLTGNNTFHIWLDNTSLSSLTSPVAWNTLEGPATEVYSSTTQQFTGAAGTWESYNISPYIYTGGNLLVLTDHHKMGTASGALNYYYTTITGMGMGYASGTAPTPTTNLTSTYGNKRPTIRITYSAGVPCTSIPTATLSASVDSVCTGTAFTLDASGGGFATGLTYLYQVSTDGGASWTNLDTPVLSPYFSVPGQSVTSQYRVIVTCTGSGSDTSATVTVLQSGFLTCYCTPSISSGCGTYGSITHVGFNTISNTSTCAPSPYFTSYPNADSTVTTITAGNTYTLSVDLARYSYVYAWIDYDQSGTFDEEEFTVVNTTYHTTTGQQTYDTTITIPFGAVPGLTRMRVRSTYYNYPYDAATGACTTSTYGEAEDYWINVIGATPCTGLPSATLTSSRDSTCPDIPFILTAGPTGSGGLSYQFQQSTDGGATWTNLGSSSIYPEHTVPTQTATTQYRVITTCAGSGADTSAAVTVVQNPPTTCYCVPSGTTSTRYIDDFTTTGGMTNISNLGTGWSPGGYGFFVSQQASANPGSTVDFNAVFGASGTYGFKIWIDWNQDGDLDDPGEVAFASSSYASSHSGNFTVPLTALTGPTRMRIGNSFTPSTGPASPCATGISGEFEDYTFVVVPLLPCSGMPTGGTVTAELDTLCPNNLTTLELSGYTGFVTGISIQWQESSSPTGPFTDVTAGEGDTTDAYTTDTLTATTYYRAKVTCTNSGMVAYSDTQEVVVQIIEVTSTTDGLSCLPGPVTLSATATPGATLYWWDAPVDGTELDTGATFVTPAISTTTTYYVSASSGSGSSLTAGRETPQATSTGYSFTNYGLIFTATAPFHLTSVDVYPTAAAGTITIELQDASGATLASSGSLSFPAGTGTTFGGGATPVTLPLDFDVPVGTGMKLVATAISANLIRDNPISGWSYPLPIGTFGQITGGLLGGSASTGAYYFFYNWKLGSGCSSDRVPVIANIGGLPVITNQPEGDTVCEGQTLTLSANATGVGGYQWYKDGMPISGATDSIYTTTAALTDNADYFVKVLGPSGCGDVWSDTVHVMVGLGGQWLGFTPNWNDAVNWCGGVPTATSDILIPAAGSVPFEPVVPTGVVAQVRDLTIFSSLLTVKGEIRFFGDVTALSGGALDAEAGSVTLSSATPQTMDVSFLATNLNVEGGGEKFMEADVLVTYNLALTNGILNMGSNRITLWSGATFTGSSATSYVRTGDMGGMKQEVGSTATRFPVGRSTYNPATITNTSGTTNFTVGVRDEALTENTLGSPIAPPTYVVNRTWDILPDEGSSPTATIALQWNMGEENSTDFNYSHVYLARFNPDSGWVNTCCANAALAPPVSGSGPFKATQGALTEFGSFTVGSSGGAPLTIAQSNGSGFAMTAYPNPANEQVTVALQGATRSGRVSLSDLSGRELMAHFPENGKAIFDLRNLASGMYFLTYSDGVQRHTIKINKE